ncbi:MAG: hypothetical protein M0C28_40655 [Candidatus Moduliflexus flocculans]|nr:hypothetical protein [Candidatus Moduliflexus flocculans]
MLLWDDAAFGLQKARKADVYVYTKSHLQGPARLLRDRRDAQARQEAHVGRRAGEGVHVVGRPDAGRLHVHARQGEGAAEAPGIAVAARRTTRRARRYPTVVYIYEKLTQGHNQFATPTGERLQQVGLHEQRLRRPAARHHLQDQVLKKVCRCLWC